MAYFSNLDPNNLLGSSNYQDLALTPPTNSDVPALNDNVTTPTTSGGIGSIIAGLGTDVVGALGVLNNSPVSVSGGGNAVSNVPGTYVTSQGVTGGGAFNLGGSTTDTLLVIGGLAVGAFLLFRKRKKG